MFVRVASVKLTDTRRHRATFGGSGCHSAALVPGMLASPIAPPASDGVEGRLEALETEVSSLRRELARLREKLGA